MPASLVLLEATIVRRAFAAWSIEIPSTLAETFVADESYWHAWDEQRSISLTSMVLTDKHGPVPAHLIVARLPALDGAPFEELPPGLVGRATTAPAIQPARASRMLSGMLVTDGRVLLATITSDDADWARRTWLSIRAHAAPLPSRRERRAQLKAWRRRR